MCGIILFIQKTKKESIIKKFIVCILFALLPVAYAPSTLALPVSDCKLIESSYPRSINNHLFTGFPSLNYNMPSAGSFNIAIIPVHFSDLPGDIDTLNHLKNDMQTFVDYFNIQSTGRVKFRWKYPNQSILIPGSYKDYFFPHSTYDTDFAQMLLDSADPYFDFTGVNNVVFVFPKDQQFIRTSIQGFYGLTQRDKLYTNESMINNYMIHGRYFVDIPGHAVWSYWAHELLHGFSLPDLYAHPWSPTVKNVRSEVDSYGWAPYNGWDIMASQDGPSRSLSTWTKFTLDWLDDTQVLCEKPDYFSNYKVTLVPNETIQPGIKSVIIPFSSTRALVIESRRETSFNRQGPGDPVDNGIMLYEVDAARGHGEVPILPLKRKAMLFIKNATNTPPYYNALMYVGETFQYENLYIKYISESSVDEIIISNFPIVESSTTKALPKNSKTKIVEKKPNHKKK